VFVMTFLQLPIVCIASIGLIEFPTMRYGDLEPLFCLDWLKMLFILLKRLFWKKLGC